MDRDCKNRNCGAKFDPQMVQTGEYCSKCVKHLSRYGLNPSKITIKNIWDWAWSFAMADPRIANDVKTAEQLDPSQVTESDFFRQCAWAIFGAGLKYDVLIKLWPAIQKAFFYWDVKQVVAQSDSVKTQVLQIFNNHKKVNSVLDIAKWLDKQGWPHVKTEFLSLIKVDQQGNIMVTDKLLEWLDQRPGIGKTLAAYVAKDIGVQSIKDDKWMRRLAGWLGYSPDAMGVLKMALDMQSLSKKKINVIDTVLWNWARNQQWLVQPPS